MKKKILLISAIIVIVIIIVLTASIIVIKNKEKEEYNQEIAVVTQSLQDYFSYIENGEYEKMYDKVIESEDISKEKFLSRNQNIYEGINASNIEIQIQSAEKMDNGDIQIKYMNKMNTSAGNVEFENIATFEKNARDVYKIKWSSNLIFPDLEEDYKVRVSRVEGNRGQILDRNGNVLAGQEEVSGETIRVYPYKETASHVTGYIQGISAEELEAKKNDGYSSTSVIGKAGVEQVYESRLRAVDGVKIYIEDSEGNIVKTIAERASKDGEDIKLTIDINMQVKLYEQTKGSSGFFVVMNPKTGEILSLVSTPSYDANMFITGMTNEEWNEILNDEEKPLYSKFLGSWCPRFYF